MAPPVHPRLVAVLGDPVEHSLSPPMQNAAFEALGLPFVYIAARVASGHLREAVEALRILGARGANVTVPHKEAAAEVADWLSPDAKAAGTVNTLVFDEGAVLGYTTDGAGLCRALEDVAHFKVAGRRVLLLGAGGAARAVGVALAQRGASIVTVVNRTVERAEALAARIQRAAGEGTATEACPWPQGAHRWAGLLERADLVVQATSLGIQGASATAWAELPLERLPEQAVVTDLVYGPQETPFLAAAARAGRRALSGDWMLLYQGAESFRLWTGQDAPVSVMRSALDRFLRRGREPSDASPIPSP